MPAEHSALRSQGRCGGPLAPPKLLAAPAIDPAFGAAKDQSAAVASGSSWADRQMAADEGAGAGERAAPGLKVRIPKRPSVDHVRPDLQGHGDIRGARGGRKAGGVGEERLG